MQWGHFTCCLRRATPPPPLPLLLLNARAAAARAPPAGTPLGDPIEVGAAAAVLLQPASSGGRPLLMSSSKAQLGHAEPAAGIVGLLRLRAQIAHAAVAPMLHLRHVNPYLGSVLRAGGGGGSAPVQLARAALPWAAVEGRAAGVSSFAFMVRAPLAHSARCA